MKLSGKTFGLAVVGGLIGFGYHLLMKSANTG